MLLLAFPLNNHVCPENRDKERTKGVFIFLPLTLSSIPENIPRSCQHDPDVPGPWASHHGLESRHLTQEDMGFSLTPYHPQNLQWLRIASLKGITLQLQAFKATVI